MKIILSIDASNGNIKHPEILDTEGKILVDNVPNVLIGISKSIAALYLQICLPISASMSAPDRKEFINFVARENNRMTQEYMYTLYEENVK
jgi:hypothetical protein